MSERSFPIMPANVAEVFESFPAGVKDTLLEVRWLIFETAAAMAEVGPLTETLKWGEPAYLTEATRSGSTIRLGWSAKSAADGAILFNCRTTLIDSFHEHFPGVFRTQGTRAILLRAGDPLPDPPLSECLGLALTYHQRANAPLI